MNYTTDYNPNMPGSGSTIGGLAKGPKADRPETELESITSRVHRMAENMNEIGYKLRTHADGVHGGVPETGAKDAPQPVRSGQLGALHDALDMLERTHSMVAEQAARNCTLA